MSEKTILPQFPIGTLAAVIASTAVAFLSYSRLEDRYAGTERAAEDLAISRRLAGKIEELSQKPQKAQEREIQISELSAKIEAAARAEGIQPQQLVRIEPGMGFRSAGSLYTEKPTGIELQRVTLSQSARVLHRIATLGAGLGVRAIRLQTPPGEELGDRWNVEATVSYYVYAFDESNDR